MRAGCRIFTVPIGRPFLTVLAEALLAGNLPVPGGTRPSAMALSDVTLLLPTRRATRALQRALLAASGAPALLMPRIRPIIGGMEDGAAGLLAGAEDFATDEAGSLRPAISDIARELALAKLIVAWSEAERGGRGTEGGIAGYEATAAATPAQAVRLARELARLMDAMEIEDVDLAAMQSLVPEALAEHWQKTLAFLRIVTEHWPRILEERGLVSRMQHEKRLVLEEARRLRTNPPAAPVIVAGVMSSAPAVTELLRAVASLPNGALVLPGLDQTLDAESWEAILPSHPEHPQFGMRKLLAALGVAREEVQPLPGEALTPVEAARSALASEAMRPARTTQRWHLFAGTARGTAEALAGVSILEAASAEEEAEAIALILREVAETPGRTGALVTPDRGLARRVTARLATWGLDVEDSGGQPLARTPIGAFLELVIEAAASGFAPVQLMALLKHPFCRLGLDADALAAGRRALELAVFRTPYFGQGMAGVAAALEQAQHDLRTGGRRHRAVSRLGRGEWTAAGAVVRALGKAFAPLEALLASAGKMRLQALAEAHVSAAEALAADRAGTPAASLWQGAAGEEASRFFAALVDEQAVAPDITAADYPDLYRSLVAELAVRPAAPTHPRLSIWEPYESRLQQPDVVILGSLNEGTWPQAADPGPWLNRPMRAELGMPAPEERIGDAAHIFTSLLGGPQVYLTRAAKIDGVPTVPSRWLLRLQALLGGAGLRARPDRPWLAWARERSALAGPPRPVAAPEPRPPLALRPRQMSVTTIERWIANPYAVYAQRILALDPLPPLGQKPDAALRGDIVHDALGRFARRFPDRLPEDVCAELVALARARLEELTGAPRVAAFWAPRFARFAAWFADTEHTRREGVTRTLAEVEGAIVLDGPAGPFTLRARADRIDVGPGGIVISDYKTGSNPRELASRAERGEAPQLPLEAAIALADGFTGLASPHVAGLRYISASGGEPPGQQCTLRNADAATLAAEARAGLLRLIAAFDDPTTPYRALRRARFNHSYRYDAYAHLARVAEWAAQTAEET